MATLFRTDSCSVLIYAHPGQPKNYEIIITLNKTTNTHCGSSSRKIVKFGQIAKASLNNIFLKHCEIWLAKVTIVTWKTGHVLGPVHTYPDIFESATFSSGYGYRPRAYGEFASKSGNFWIRSPEWKFLNPITFRIRVDGRIRIFSDTMTSQNWH